MKALALGLALTSCQLQPAQPQPSIFITHTSDGRSITSTAKARPMGKAMGDISIAELNEFRRQEHPPSLERLCYLDSVERSSFVGTDRHAQLALEEDFKYLPQDPFRQAISTSDGGNFVARVGLAEECDTGAVGAILVIQDASNGKIVQAGMAFEPFMYLWPPKGDAPPTVSNCIRCDVYDFLVYDPKRRKFRLEGE